MNIPSVAEIKRRLESIFPEGTEHRVYMVREMAAKTVFVSLYADAIEGNDRWIRPNQVCRFCDEQATLMTEEARQAWFIASSKSGYHPTGRAWFADTTREPIRDETIGEGFLHVRAIVMREGVSVTSALGRYALGVKFAALFDADLSEDEFQSLAIEWRVAHLSRAALARQAIVASSGAAAADTVPVRFPGGELRHLSPGASSIISKAVVEIFAPRFLKTPHVLWLSESGNKVVAQDDIVARQIGFVIDPSQALPDLILVDLGEQRDGSDLLIVFVEIVASDGPINRQRKESLMQLANGAGFDEKQTAFVTAFLDRSSSTFKKAIVEIAWGSFVWLVSEPDNLIDMRDGRAVTLHALKAQG